MSFTFLVFLTSSAFAAPPDKGSKPPAKAPDVGTLAPRIQVSGQARTDCALEAVLEGEEKKPHRGTAPLSLPPGAYRVRIDCPGDPKMVTELPSVRIQTHKTAEPKVNMEPARIRVVAQRNGDMLGAEVRIFARGRTQDAPLYVHNANSKFTVAAGRYDLIVSAVIEKNAPRVEASLEGARLRAKKLAAFTADLSNGALRARATANGKNAKTLVRVTRRGSNDTIARGESGQVFDLPPGRYVVESTLAESANFAVRQSTVWVRSKKRTEVKEKFETGRIEVRATGRGKALAATIRLGVPGAADFFNYFEAPGEALLSPGTYRVEAESKADQKSLEQKVTIKRGRTTKVRFDFTPATLVIEVVRAGRPVEVEKIEVRIAGGGGPAGRPNFDGEYTLWPGRYEIVANLANGDVARDGPFDVRLGQTITRTVEFAHGTLSVAALQGGKVAKNAKVQIFRPGAAKATATVQGSGTIALSPGTYDVKVVEGPNARWHEGVKVLERKNTRLNIEMRDSAAPEKDDELPEGDNELPEGDAP